MTNDEEVALRKSIAHEIELYFNGRERWSITDLLAVVRGEKELWETQTRNIKSSKVYSKIRG